MEVPLRAEADAGVPKKENERTKSSERERRGKSEGNVCHKDHIHAIGDRSIVEA